MTKKIFYFLISMIVLVGLLVAAGYYFLLAVGETAGLIIELNDEVIELEKDNIQKNQLIARLLEKIETDKNKNRD